MKFFINKSSSVPIRDQLVEQIGLAVASGSLHAEEKLPSVRALAKRLGIHYNTVSSAYNHLADVGLLDVKQGSGVRVAGTQQSSHLDLASMDHGSFSLNDLLKDFLARLAEHGFSRADLRTCVDQVLSSKSIKTIYVVDRHKDFLPLLCSELSPHFNLPVKGITLEEARQTNFEESLVLCSLYHVLSVRSLAIDPTRLVVFNVEPGRAEIEIAEKVKAGSMVLLVSVSQTLLKMATTLFSAIRGDEIAVRSIELHDERELAYSLKFADIVICDEPSLQTINKLGQKPPSSVFHMFSQTTINRIQDRLNKWG